MDKLFVSCKLKLSNHFVLEIFSIPAYSVDSLNYLNIPDLGYVFYDRRGLSVANSH